LTPGARYCRWTRQRWNWRNHCTRK